MDKPLHLLHLEDDPNDAALVQSALEAGGLACSTTRVENRADFVRALERGNVDLIMSDFSVPAFDGSSALETVRTKWPNVPFILVSGTVGEEAAIQSLKGGATDYVLKERLGRLVPAVHRALREAEERVEGKRLEEQFVQSQKMEVVGQLAGGVAHDFNNMLSVILGYSDLLRAKLNSADPMHHYAEEIGHAAMRAAALTRQLLLFSRKQVLQLVVVDLNEIMKGMDIMLRRLIHESVELTVVPGIEIGRIKADPGCVGQVLMNLVINARDAMPGGGKLTITTENVTLDENHARNHAEVPSGIYAMLAVSDTGTGMTEEVKAHLFDAFFTTKPKGEGTGLGLATCQIIVKQCGGHIVFDSEIGKGTTFKIYFPRVEQPLDPSANPIQIGGLPRGTETVLLVEDEPAVRHLASGVLESQGYRVLRAPNGLDALGVARQHAREHEDQQIGLVVSDVIMPQMGGKVMAEWLKTSNPNLKVLFTSGYTDETIAHDRALDPGVAFLPKPYTLAALTGKVRELLDSKI